MGKCHFYQYGFFTEFRCHESDGLSNVKFSRKISLNNLYEKHLFYVLREDEQKCNFYQHGFSTKLRFRESEVLDMNINSIGIYISVDF